MVGAGLPAVLPAMEGERGYRIRRLGIVLLGRKLLIDLWRYLKTGVLPEGVLPKA